MSPGFSGRKERHFVCSLISIRAQWLTALNTDNLLKAMTARAILFLFCCLMPLWKQESERAWKVFKGLCFMPWHILWQKVLRVSQEMRVKLGSGVKAGTPRFPGGHLPCWLTVPSSRSEQEGAVESSCGSNKTKNTGEGDGIAGINSAFTMLWLLCKVFINTDYLIYPHRNPAN